MVTLAEDRESDGKFAPKGSGDRTGAPNSDRPKGRRRGAEPKNEGGDEGAPREEEAGPPKTRREKAEARLAQAQETHEQAVAEETATAERFAQAKAKSLEKLDERDRQRRELAARADRYADAAEAEEAALAVEYDKVTAEAEAAGVLADADDFGDPTGPHADHPLNQKRQAITSRLGELENYPVDDLRREAQRNRKPDKSLEQARAALAAGDLEAFGEFNAESEASEPSTEFLDYAVRDEIRQNYRQKHGVDPGDDVISFLEEREQAKRKSALPDTSIHLDPVRGTPAEWEAARANAEKRWYERGFTEPPTAEELERVADGIIRRTGSDYYPDDLTPAFDAAQKARRKRARAERAVAVHEREVKRMRDADGDGRTGDAEARDDEKQPSAKE